ncbi:MAG: transglycosylase SLT domain-containing protein [bacterium]|nr:transglycosylase SLT domain-containing protein [bacterium]
MIRRIKNLSLFPDVRHFCVLLLVLSLVSCGASEGDFQEALNRVREGYVNKAIEQFEEIVEKEPESELGDRAALILGNLLVQSQRHVDALEPLRRAIGGKVGAPYARLLLARAAIQGELSDVYAEATEHAFFLQSSGSGDVSPLLRQEATFLLAKLYLLQEKWSEAARFGGMFLDQWDSSRLRNEARWVTAQAQGESERAAEAHALFATIWYETPDSPWALEARDAMRELERFAGVEPRRLQDDEHYSFIQALRSAGLHKDALLEIDVFLSRYSRHRKASGALFLKSMSLHAERRNGECVAAAAELKRRHPRSQWVPAAGIYAIKCLRRSDRTSQIRSWADWIVDTYPRHDKAMEALYNLGVYLGNVESEEEGIRVLERLVRIGGDHPNVRDALWKIAWLKRKQDKKGETIATLQRLVNEHPDSGYRKAALYWLARLHPSRDRAIELYQTCVEEFPNDYYGHKAAEYLLSLDVKPRQVGGREAFPAVDHLTDPAARAGAPPAYRRAVELKSIGLYEFAAAELETMPEVESDRGLRFALAELYSRSGNTWEAAAIIRRHFKDFIDSGSRDSELVPTEFWHVVFPFNYRTEIEKALNETGLIDSGIDPYLTASLIKLESRFLTTAISRVGAVGLMQLMPETVERLARKLKLGTLSRSDLFDPETNIRLGTYYLASLIEEFEGDWFQAICSYNAGSGPVKEWWSEKPQDQPLDEFIEYIPYVDTRLYIKQVLGDYKNYEWIYPE